VVGYLRGIIKPLGDHGVRSLLLREIAIEHTRNTLMREGMTDSFIIDSGIFSSLEHKAKKESLADFDANIARSWELSAFNFYALDRRNVVKAPDANSISAVKLFQFLNNSDIIEQLTAGK